MYECFLTSMYVHHGCRILQRAEEGIESLETEVIDGCELLCRCWELKPGFSARTAVLLTTKPSLHPLGDFSKAFGFFVN